MYVYILIILLQYERDVFSIVSSYDAIALLHYCAFVTVLAKAPSKIVVG